MNARARSVSRSYARERLARRCFRRVLARVALLHAGLALIISIL